jgi:hypothetical protein
MTSRNTDKSVRRRPIGRLLLLAGALLGLAVLSGCTDKAPPAWPWWTSADSTAAKAELAEWRDSTNTRLFVEGASEPLLDSAGIIARDSTSPTGDSLIKIRRLTGFGLAPGSLIRWDSLLFGVTVDSLMPEVTGDTFCHVTTKDSSATDFCILSLDEYWVVKYRPDTTVDTTAAPPETTITWRANTGALISGPTEFQKNVPSMAKRYLHLRKTGPDYELRRLSGYGLYLPTTSDAPVVRYLILNYQGSTDTFRLGAQMDHVHGIYNLRDKDSLYEVRTGESLSVQVVTDAPSLAGDQYYFLARVDGRRSYLARGTGMTGFRRVAFTTTGVRHLTVEVIPQSNLLYPDESFTATIWSLPVRVR